MYKQTSALLYCRLCFHKQIYSNHFCSNSHRTIDRLDIFLSWKNSAINKSRYQSWIMDNREFYLINSSIILGDWLVGRMRSCKLKKRVKIQDKVCSGVRLDMI